MRLGLFLENNQRTKHKQSLSSLGSNNTSPLSTLTNSSEADMSRHEKSQISKRGCESIGSLLSVSISEHSNASSNSLGRRHSLTGEFFNILMGLEIKIKIFQEIKINSKVWTNLDSSKLVNLHSEDQHDRCN